MSNNAVQLEVTSHVGRDLLASAQLFRDEKDVVWEYVVNSLQYVDRGISPRVQVFVKPRAKVIEVHDNGTGMDAAGISHYFEIHGENVERRVGRRGRGKFGTGKCAAFGIAKRLTVDTRRNGLRNVVELTRDAIDESSGENIPLNHVIRDEPTDLANGTVVTISEIVLKKISTQRIIDYIERHLQSFRAGEPEVAVNDHVCRYDEPEIDGEPRVFTPPERLQPLVGDVELVIKVSRKPLDESECGVIVTAGEGNVLAVEDCGVARKELGNYLFGYVDVPALDEESDGIAAFDSTRSLALNPAHPAAAGLLSFLGSKLEEVRRELVARARDVARSEQARWLAEEANKIAEVLNKDFEAVRERLREIRAASSSPGSAASAFGASGGGDEEDDSWTEGDDQPGTLEETGPAETAEGRGQSRPVPTIPRAGEPDEQGLDLLSSAGGRGSKPRPRGGFSVTYENLGKESARSEFDHNALKILINLDHPVVSIALHGGDRDDPMFRRLSYEIAFSEYAIGLQYRMLEQDPDIPGDEVLYDVRDTLNRVSRSAATLYR